jgi:DNA-binding NtrC family response regulator
VDDDPIVCDLVAHWLGRENQRVETRESGEAALTSLGHVQPDVVILDLSMPGLDGLEVLVRIKSAMPRTPIIILTGTTEIATVVTAMQRGAFDYLAKPVARDNLLETVAKALDHVRRTRRIAELDSGKTAADELDHLDGIVGRSVPMRALFRQIERVAASDVTVLVHGESGTGKELVARALHDRSARHKGPFVALNCAAIPESLQESELFGHEKGAFTGAVGRHSGRFEQANGGTLFLDEIGEIAPSLQAKLLRVFQERRFHRVGGTQEVQVDVRIVAATHRDLFADVAQGRFREDLYYRLAVFELEVPPLRDRPGDLPLLVERLTADLAKKHNKPDLELHPDTLELLTRYRWPGNVRELQNALERAVVVASDRLVRAEDLPRRVNNPLTPNATQASSSATLSAGPTLPTRPADNQPRAAPPTEPTPILPVIELERRAILDALARTGSNVSEASRLLGIPRTTMYRKLKRHDIQA